MTANIHRQIISERSITLVHYVRCAILYSEANLVSRRINVALISLFLRLTMRSALKCCRRLRVLYVTGVNISAWRGNHIDSYPSDLIFSPQFYFSLVCISHELFLTLFLSFFLRFYFLLVSYTFDFIIIIAS